jgi:glutaredoxin-related protein
MRIRLFGSNNCPECLKTISLIQHFNIPFEYIDGMSNIPEVEKFCDDNKVDHLPHLQFLSDSGNIIIEHIGLITSDQMFKYINENCRGY